MAEVKDDLASVSAQLDALDVRQAVEVEIRAEVERGEREIQEFLARVEGRKVEVPLELDTAPATQRLEAFASRRVEVPASVDLDTEKAVGRIEGLKASRVVVAGEVDLDATTANQRVGALESRRVAVKGEVDLDAGPANRRINALEGRRVTVDGSVDLDTAEAGRRIGAFGARRVTVRGSVDLEVGTATGRINALESRRVLVRGRVELDVSAANARISALQRRRVSITVEARGLAGIVRDLGSADRLATRLNGRNIRMSMEVRGLAGIVGQLGAVRGLVSWLDGRQIDIRINVRGLAGAIAQLIVLQGILTALGGILGGGGSGGGLGGLLGAGPTAVIAGVGLVARFGALGGAISLVAAAVGPTVAALATAGATAVTTAGGVGLLGAAAWTLANSQAPATKKAMADLAKEFEDFKKDSQTAFDPAAQKLGALGQLALDVARVPLPQLGAAAERTVGQIRAGFESVIRRITPSERDSFAGILDQIPGILGRITTAVGDVGGAFVSFLSASMPNVVGLSVEAASIAKRLREWADSEAGRTAIAKFLSSAVPLVQSFGRFLKDTVPPLIAIGIEHGPTVAKVIEGIGWVIANVAIPAIENFLIWGGKVIAWIVSLVQAWRDNSNPILNIVKGLWEGIRGITVGGWQVVLGIVQTFLGLFTGNWETFKTGIVNIWDGLWKAIFGLGRGAVLILEGIGDAIFNTLKAPFVWAYDAIVGNSIVPDLVRDVISWIGGLPQKGADALLALPGKIGGKFSEAWTWISGEVSGWPGELKTAGINAIVGLINGFTERAQQLYDRVRNIGKNALNAVKNALRIQSPSQEMHEVGKYAGEGLVNGVSAMARASEEAGAAVGVGLVRAVRTGVDALNFLEKEMIETGRAGGAGLAQGIEASAARVKAAMTQIVRSALEAARAQLQVRSPSEKMREIGGFAVDGFVMAIMSGKDRARDAARALAQAASEGARSIAIAPSSQSSEASDLQKRWMEAQLAEKQALAYLEKAKRDAALLRAQRDPRADYRAEQIVRNAYARYKEFDLREDDAQRRYEQFRDTRPSEPAPRPASTPRGLPPASPRPDAPGATGGASTRETALLKEQNDLLKELLAEMRQNTEATEDVGEDVAEAVGVGIRKGTLGDDVEKRLDKKAKRIERENRRT